ncbi:MAG: hypothetical protein ACR2RF_16140 [Geminicoccaceae bacterium]
MGYLIGSNARQFHSWTDTMEHVFAIVIIVLLFIPLVVLAWRDRRYFWKENGIFRVVIILISISIAKDIFEWWVYQYAFGFLLGILAFSLLEALRNVVKDSKPDISGDAKPD